MFLYPGRLEQVLICEDELCCVDNLTCNSGKSFVLKILHGMWRYLSLLGCLISFLSRCYEKAS